MIRTFSVLGQETRLSIYRLLCEFGDQGACPSDIAEKLGVAAATLSFHLKTLTQAGLLDAQADGRFIRYRANHQPTREMVRFAAKHLCGLGSAAEPLAPPAKATAGSTHKPEPTANDEAPAQQQLSFDAPPQPPAPPPADPPAKATATPRQLKPALVAHSRIRLRPVRILYLSAGNAARGLIAEALTNAIGQGRFVGYSAGSQPLGRVNRYAIKQLELAGHPCPELRSKSWEEFVGPDATELDLLIGLWPAKSAPAYPEFRGRCQRTYWPVDDPSTVTASVNEAERAFAQCYQNLRERIQSLLDRLGEQLDKATSAALGNH